MGDPVPPTPPDWGTCPTCCALLPPTIPGKVTMPWSQVFEGAVTREPANPCMYHGNWTADGDTLWVEVQFCALGHSNCRMEAKRNGIDVCGVTWSFGNECDPNIDETGPTGCRFEF